MRWPTSISLAEGAGGLWNFQGMWCDFSGLVHQISQVERGSCRFHFQEFIICFRSNNLVSAALQVLWFHSKKLPPPPCFQHQAPKLFQLPVNPKSQRRQRIVSWQTCPKAETLDAASNSLPLSRVGSLQLCTFCRSCWQQTVLPHPSSHSPLFPVILSIQIIPVLSELRTSSELRKTQFFSNSLKSWIFGYSSLFCVSRWEEPQAWAFFPGIELWQFGAGELMQIK